VQVIADPAGWLIWARVLVDGDLREVHDEFSMHLTLNENNQT